MSTLEKVQLLEDRIRKAIALIEKLKSENAALQDELEQVKSHNEELKSYTTDFSKNNRLIEEGITNALSQLEQLEEFTEQAAQQEEQTDTSEPPEEDFSFEAEDVDPDAGTDDEDFPVQDEEDRDAPLY